VAGSPKDAAAVILSNSEMEVVEILARHTLVKGYKQSTRSPPYLSGAMNNTGDWRATLFRGTCHFAMVSALG
jgi:hypothetical protein